MKKRILSLTLLFSAVLFAHAEDSFSLSPEAIGKLELAYATVEPRTLHRMVYAPGSITLDETRVVDVVPRITGLIAEDHQALGSVVKAGDPLFTLESGDLAVAITAYVDAEQAMTFEQAALAREKELFDRNLSSKENLQTRELEFKKALAGHARALQPLKLLHFDEGSIHVYLENVSSSDYTTLKVVSPCAGEVIEKSVRRGASVEPSERLFTIADLSRVWVDFHISLRDTSGLEKGLVVVVESSVAGGNRGEAKIEYLAPIANEETRTILVRAMLPNEGHGWRPGTPVTVAIPVGSKDPVLSVPATALVDYRGGKAVFVLSGEGVFEPVPVETGESDGKVTAILSGLQSGQTVVSANAAQLKGHLEMTNK